MRKVSIVSAGVVISLLLTFGAVLASDLFLAWNQDFEQDTAGWLDSTNDWYGSITHNPGTGTATFEGDAISAPFSRFDGYRSEWPGPWIAEIAVYLDPDWTEGEGFDYTVASSRTNGAHLRDFIFHVGVHADGRLLVNGSNNSDFFVNDYKLLNDGDKTPYQVISAGWYTLQHVFYEASGSLAVDLNLFDSNGQKVFTTTRINAADTIPDVVGGNRYSWFTFISVEGGIEVDNHKLILEQQITKDGCKDDGWKSLLRSDGTGFKNQGQCIQYFNTGK